MFNSFTPTKFFQKTALLLTAVSIGFSGSVKAQLTEAGLPESFRQENYMKAAISRATVPTIVSMPIDVTAELAKDQQYRAERISAPRQIDIAPDRAGAWVELPNGDRIWRLQLEIPNAVGVYALLDHYYIPEGAKLFFYSADTSTINGAFTHISNTKEAHLTTANLKGNRMVIEYFEPLSVKGRGNFHIFRVDGIYRNQSSYPSSPGTRELKLRTGFGASNACQINKACETDWDTQARGVCRQLMITTNGGFVCSGSLVNNFKQDFTAYYLTADHCLQPNTADNLFNNWRFDFQYRSATCTNPASEPSPLRSVTGSTFRARWFDTDVALLQLNTTLTTLFNHNAYFNGWEKTTNPGASVTLAAIHHPAFDIQKISKRTTSGSVPRNNNQIIVSGTPYPALHHYIISFTEGATEGGSSGSPLFTSTGKRIVGQLLGGNSECSPSVSGINIYGVFGLSWDGGGTSASRLKDWLDPDNTQGSGSFNLNGIDPVFTYTSKTPSTGSPGTPVTITGTNLTGATVRFFNNITATDIVATANQITCKVPAGATTGAVSIIKNGITVSAGSFTVNNFSATGFSPSNGMVGTVVTVNGVDMVGATATLNGVSQTISSNTGTSFQFTIQAGATTGPVVVSKGGTDVNLGNFTVDPFPSLNITSNTTISAGTYTDITVSNNATATVSSSITVNGNITLNEGTTLAVTSLVNGPGNLVVNGCATLSVTQALENSTSVGNIRLSGTRNYGNCLTLRYTGSTASVNAGEDVPATLANLEINKTNGTVTLSKNLNIRNAVRVIAGGLAQGSHTINYLSSASGTAYLAPVTGTYSPGVSTQELFMPFTSPGWHLMGSAGMGGQQLLAWEINGSNFVLRGPFAGAVPHDRPNVWLYNPSHPTDQGFMIPSDVNNILNTGQALRVWLDPTFLSGAKKFKFLGTPFSGTVNLVLNRCTSGCPTGWPTADPNNNGWNMLSNPFNCPVNWDNVTKSNVAGAVYLFDASLGAYRFYLQGSGASTAGSTIGIGQGFFARATGASASLNFTQGSKVEASNPTRYRVGSMYPEVVLRLEDNQGRSNQTGVRFVEGTSLLNDDIFDASYMPIPNLGLALRNPEGTAFSVNSIAPTTARVVMPVLLDVPAGQHKFTVPVLHAMEGTEIVLEDRMLGVSYTLSAGMEHYFQVNANLPAQNRFFLVLNPSAPASIGSNLGQALGLYPNPARDNVTLTGFEGNLNYRILNMVGAEVSHGTLTAGNTISVAQLAKGVYQLVVAQQGQQHTFRLIVE